MIVSEVTEQRAMAPDATDHVVMGQDVVGRPGRSQRWALAAIDWYQRAASGRPSPCRFFPSCSTYAYEAFTLHGTRRGSWLTLRRLLRCRPFGSSGYDPVPDRDHSDRNQRGATCPDHAPPFAASTFAHKDD